MGRRLTSETGSIAGFNESEGVEARAMRSNLVTIVGRLHDPADTVQTQVADLLAQGMIVVVDLSLVTGAIGLQISGLLLKSIFWLAPDQPFVLPARILNFAEVGTDHPDAHATGASQDIGARRFEGEARKAESELAQAVLATITTREKSKGVEFYFSPKDHPYGADMVACYKPRLAAQVAEKLDDGTRRRFCSPGGQYVQDQYLDKALKSSGLVAEVQWVRASRNEQRGTGDYYVIPKTTFKGKPELRGTLILENE